MMLKIKSLQSGSGGNCLLIWTRSTAIVIDCGFKTQDKCRRLLRKHAGRVDELDAAIISHAHGDHISCSSLRLFSQFGVPVMAHERVVKQIRGRHACDDWDEPPMIQAFSDEKFDAGDFRIRPIEVPHDPEVPTFGFVIRCGRGEKRRKIVVCTDFYNYEDVLHHFVDANFIFVESNHDPELLRRHPNDASHYHMSNEKTAWLLYHAVRQSEASPQAVMLGHLSLQRNREELALNAVKTVFDRQRIDIRFDLSTAPPSEPSETIRIH